MITKRDATPLIRDKKRELGVTGVHEAGNANEPRILIACGAAYCIANIGWWVQPAIVNEVIARFQVGETRAGLVASAEMTAIAIGSVSFARLLQRYSLRRIALVGMVIALLGATWSAVAQLYNVLLISRAVVGLGEGAALAVATAGIADFRDPDRAYGKINVAAILFGSFDLSFTRRDCFDFRAVAQCLSNHIGRFGRAFPPAVVRAELGHQANRGR